MMRFVWGASVAVRMGLRPMKGDENLADMQFSRTSFDALTGGRVADRVNRKSEAFDRAGGLPAQCPKFFPFPGNSTNSGEDALVRRSPPGWLRGGRCLLHARAGTRASRADQGVRPTNLFGVPAVGKVCGIWPFRPPLDSGHSAREEGRRCGAGLSHRQRGPRASDRLSSVSSTAPGLPRKARDTRRVSKTAGWKAGLQARIACLTQSDGELR
jgi:hypothetical protein